MPGAIPKGLEEQNRPEGYEKLRPIPTGEQLLLHGHEHSRWVMKQYPGHPLMLNVACDNFKFTPQSELDILNRWQQHSSA